MKSLKKTRKIEFDGDHKDNSLLIGNYGDVDFVVKGNFELSGMIYSKSTIEFTVIGNGTIRFHGFCKKIIIHLVKGECSLDLSELTSKEVCCFSLRDKSTIKLGPTRIISRANVQDEAVFQYASKPLLQNYSVVGNGKIEALAAA
jgi:hypothetical protein